MNGKKKFMKAMKVSRCRKFLIEKVFCQAPEHYEKYLGGNWPDVNDACDPSLIEWKNLGVSQFSRFLR
jgi:hypothetical protein